MKLKARHVWLLVLGLLAAVVTAAAFIPLHLTAWARASVAEPAAQALGIEVGLDRAVARVAGAHGSLEGLRIANPAGHEDPWLLRADAIRADLRVPPLLRRAVHLEHLDIRGLELTISRNATGGLNLAAFASPPMQVVEVAVSRAAPAPPPPAPSPARAAGASPDVLVEQLDAEVRLAYVDRQGRAAPARFVMDLVLRGSNLRTASGTAAGWGELSLDGHLQGDTGSFVTRLDGRLAPLSDAANPSFDLHGSITNVDLALLASVFTNLSATASNAAVDLRLSCRDGQLVRSNTVITVRVRGLALTGPAARNLKGAVFRELTVPVQLYGPWMAPEADWAGAVTKAVLESVAKDPDTLMKLAGAGGSAASEKIGKALDKLGGKRKKPVRPATTNAPPVATPATAGPPEPAPAGPP